MKEERRGEDEGRKEGRKTMRATGGRMSKWGILPYCFVPRKGTRKEGKKGKGKGS